jgi:uncharacterized membrane protein YdjX (TVP38/TMEM64 family)
MCKMDLPLSTSRLYKLRGDILRVVLLVLFFSFMAILFGYPEFRRLLFDVDTIRSILKGGGDTSGYILSLLTFILASGVLVALGVPRLWASVIGGGIYGAPMGFILSMLAALFGASVLYLAGKSILAAVMERREGDRIGMWKVRFQENAFWWVLHGRLFPFSNSTAMSLLCGSCKVRFIPFLFGSLVGFVPLAVVFTIYGSGGVRGNILQIGSATVLLLLSFFCRRFMRGWFSEKEMGGVN